MSRAPRTVGRALRPVGRTLRPVDRTPRPGDRTQVLLILLPISFVFHSNIKVKHKMVYAATNTTLKSTFGTGQLLDEVFATAKVSLGILSLLQFCKQAKH